MDGKTAQLTKITEIFYQFDRNNNDTIDRAELGELSIALNNALSTAELQDFFKEFDNDKSGFITLKEFVDYWKGE